MDQGVTGRDPDKIVDPVTYNPLTQCLLMIQCDGVICFVWQVNGQF